MEEKYHSLVPVNPEGLDEVARSLLEERSDQPENKNSPSKKDLANYIILPGRSHGNYSYPDLLVSKSRVNARYTWEKAHIVLAQKEAKMLSLRQFVDFLQLLKVGNVNLGNGDKLDVRKANDFYYDFSSKSKRTGDEWLDTSFPEQGKIGHDHRYSGGEVVPDHVLDLEEYLGRRACLDFNQWTANANSQGLPVRGIRTVNSKKADGKREALITYTPPKPGNIVSVETWDGCSHASLTCARDKKEDIPEISIRLVYELEKVRGAA